MPPQTPGGTECKTKMMSREQVRMAQIPALGAHHGSVSSSGRNVAAPAALAQGREIYCVFFKLGLCSRVLWLGGQPQALSNLCPF